MLAYATKRILSSLPVLFVVSIVVFGLIHVGAGDPALVIAGDLATPDQIADIRQRLGLDRPLPQQYLTWLLNALQGDLGTSLVNRIPVSDLISQRLGPSTALAVGATILAVIVAVPLGVFAAANRGRFIDRGVMLFASAAFAMPAFLVGYALVALFSLRLGLLPVQGYRPPGDGLGPFLRHLVLPTVTLSMVYIALLARMTRATMLEVLSADYIRAARARGLGMPKILFEHALKNAAVPVLTTIGVGFALMIGGVVIIESVFSLPGLGRLTIESVLKRDYPVIQGVLLLTSVAYLAINILVDLSYRLFDPRIRY